MSKLLRADLRRLFKSKVFWLFALVMLLLGFVPISRYFENIKFIAAGRLDHIWPLDEDFFTYLIALFFIIPVMTALFVGVDYAGGTIRNKMIVGHKRRNVYLSNLITLSVADIIWSLIYLAAALAVGIPLLGMFECGLLCAVAYMALSLAVSIALTALMLMVAMLCSNRTYSAVICLLLTVALIVSGGIINSRLDEPEIIGSYLSVSIDGELVPVEPEPNPDYMTGTKRLVCEKLLDISPGGQMVQIQEMEIESGGRLMVYDLGLLALTVGMGILAFKRKDLK